jgi:hypothetical protein
MHVFRNRLWLLAWMALCVGAAFALEKPSTPLPVVRWKESSAGCTLTRGSDGKYQYKLETQDLDVTLSVDAQELQITRRRLTHFLGIFLDAHYKGASTLVFDPGTATLEYASHYHVMKASLDPEGFAQRIESGGEEVSDETSRQIEKHPEKKEHRESVARAYQKDVAELLEFVNNQTMKSMTLGQTAPHVSGWVLFGTNNRWIGKWKKREELIFRMPLSDRTLEFPFTLPPTEGEVQLKKRE